jgi:hypothetical protein
MSVVMVQLCSLKRMVRNYRNSLKLLNDEEVNRAPQDQDVVHPKTKKLVLDPQSNLLGGQRTGISSFVVVREERFRFFESEPHKNNTPHTTFFSTKSTDVS